MARAIHVGVVPLGGFVFDVRGRDRDSASLLFRRIVDRIEAPELHLRIMLRQGLGDGRRQCGLAVIDVPDRSHVYVRLAAIKFFLRHVFPGLLNLIECENLTRYFYAALPRALLTISSAIFFGTSTYLPKCIVNAPRPCVRERSSVA